MPSTHYEVRITAVGKPESPDDIVAITCVDGIYVRTTRQERETYHALGRWLWRWVVRPVLLLVFAVMLFFWIRGAISMFRAAWPY